MTQGVVPIAEDQSNDGALPVVEDQDDEMRLLKSGRVQFRLNGITFTLRRPTFGEFREFRNRSEQILEADSEDDRETRDYKFVAWIFSRFADKRLPKTGSKEANDLPYWLFSAQMIRALAMHWQSVPLASGVQ